MLEVYLLTIVTSFLTNLGLSIMLPYSIKNRGYDYDTVLKAKLEYLNFYFQLLSTLSSGKICKKTIKTFAYAVAIIIYVLKELIIAAIPVLNVFISANKVSNYDKSINKTIEQNNIENFAKKEELLFGTSVKKKNNKFSKLKRKNNHKEEQNIIEALIIDGANRNEIVDIYNDMKSELSDKISNEQEEKINLKVNSMLDYICMNADLTDKQKATMLKKLKKVFVNEENYDMKPIDYAFECSEKTMIKKGKF